MEGTTIRDNVVEIRPGTTAQTDRERELVECLLTELRKHRELNIEIDSVMMCFLGSKTEYDKDGKEEESDPYSLSIFRLVDESRPIGMTLSYMSAYIQKYALEEFRFSE
jgi:hypothetical protein